MRLRAIETNRLDAVTGVESSVAILIPINQIIGNHNCLAVICSNINSQCADFCEIQQAAIAIRALEALAPICRIT